jgi:hypothetical protein
MLTCSTATKGRQRYSMYVHQGVEIMGAILDFYLQYMSKQ